MKKRDVEAKICKGDGCVSLKAPVEDIKELGRWVGGAISDGISSAGSAIGAAGAGAWERMKVFAEELENEM
jgi:hypothetical protein